MHERLSLSSLSLQTPFCFSHQSQQYDRMTSVRPCPLRFPLLTFQIGLYTLIGTPGWPQEIYLIYVGTQFVTGVIASALASNSRLHRFQETT